MRVHVTMVPDAGEIAEVLVRYATAIDTKDWDLLRACFTEDVAADYGVIGPWTGIEATATFMEAAHVDLAPTNHMLSNFVIEVDGDHATARSYVHAVLARHGDPGTWVDAIGSYDDTPVRTSGAWRIATRTFRLIRTLSSVRETGTPIAGEPGSQSDPDRDLRPSRGRGQGRRPGERPGR